MKVFCFLNGLSAALISGTSVSTSVIKQEIISQNHLIQTSNKNATSIRQFLQYLNNELLTNKFVIKVLEQKLRGIIPGADSFFNSFLKVFDFDEIPSHCVTLLIDLAMDWDKEINWGSNSLQAMKNYIGSPQGDIAQAKRTGSKGEWHYAEVRAIRGNWTWEDFYIYMSGAKINYFVKTLSGGKYLGELISDHLHFVGLDWSFDVNGFIAQMQIIFNNFKVNSPAMNLLLDSMSVILKAYFLKIPYPTWGINYLTWDQPTNFESMALKKILENLIDFLETENGFQILQKIVTKLITGPFADDFIVDCGLFGYFTIPELLRIIDILPFNNVGVESGLNSEKITKMITSVLIKMIEKIDLSPLFNRFLSFGNNYASELDLDFLFSAKQLRDIKIWENSLSGFTMLADFLTNRDSPYQLETIFKMLGTNPGKKNFLKNSPFFHLQIAADNPNSWLNQSLDIYEKFNLF